MRWCLKLAEYEYAGKLNTNADAISRLYPINTYLNAQYDFERGSTNVEFITRDLKPKSQSWLSIVRKYPETKFLLNQTLIQNSNNCNFIFPVNYKLYDIISKSSLDNLLIKLNQFRIRNKLYKFHFHEMSLNGSLDNQNFQKSFVYFKISL